MNVVAIVNHVVGNIMAVCGCNFLPFARYYLVELLLVSLVVLASTARNLRQVHDLTLTRIRK